MKKKLSMLAVLTIGILVGCGTTSITNAEQSYPLKIWLQNRNGGMETYNVVDEETGVNYVVVSYYSDSVTMSPRYNADGTLYVSK